MAFPPRLGQLRILWEFTGSGSVNRGHNAPPSNKWHLSKGYLITHRTPTAKQTQPEKWLKHLLFQIPGFYYCDDLKLSAWCQIWVASILKVQMHIKIIYTFDLLDANSGPRRASSMSNCCGGRLFHTSWREVKTWSGIFSLSLPFKNFSARASWHVQHF